MSFVGAFYQGPAKTNQIISNFKFVLVNCVTKSLFFQTHSLRAMQVQFQVPTFAVSSLIGAQGQRVADINKTSGAVVRFTTSTPCSPFTTALIQGSDSNIKMAIDLLKIGVLHAKAADDRPTLAVKVNTGPAEQAASDLKTFAQEISGMAFSTHHVAPSANFVQRPS